MRDFFKKAVVYLLTLEAKAILRKYKPKVVAITGSVGKTSTKDAIYAVLSKYYRVRKSEKSFNSEVGLPLTILGVPNAWNNPLGWLQNLIDGLFMLLFTVQYPEWLVLEVGADRPGDIRGLSKWLGVDVAVITKLPEVPVHVEFFDSPEAVIEEKASLIDAIRPGGALLLLADDPRTRKLEHRLPAPDARILTFGFADDADVRGEAVEMVREGGSGKAAGWPVGMRMQVVNQHESVPVEVMGALGAHVLIPALAGAAVGSVLGHTVGDLASAFVRYDPPSGRMRLIVGIKDTLLIDDTYNSSPAAVTAALETLALLKPTGKRIAVLGDMMELGRHSVEEHRKVGAVVAQSADVLITVGFRARDIAQGALDKGMAEGAILQHEDSAKAGKELELMLEAGDCVLVKGSQSMRMERTVEEVMAEPELAQKLLVRQDLEWKKR